MAEAYIVAAARTAGGKKGGKLAGWHPVDLAGKVLDALVDRTGIDPAQVEDVIMAFRRRAWTANAVPRSRHFTSQRRP
jgi:acetyl-CoA acetyltransferase